MPRELLWIALIFLFSATEISADSDMLKRGQSIAEQRCGMCHAVGKFGDSPHRIVPPFRTLHERFPIEMLVEANRTGVISGHDEMPMFEFGPREMRALLSYIDSLSARGPRYVTTPNK